MISPKHFLHYSSLAWGVAIVFFVTTVPAAAKELRFTANWVFEASNAPFLLAAERGYFSDEDLDVTIDAGEGSSAVITRIASGRYQFGFGDINTMIEFNAQNPNDQQRMVYMIYNRPPMGVVTLKGSGIEHPRDLEGKSVGAPVNDTAYRLFPVLAAALNIDASQVKFDNVSPNLREPMLYRGQVDAIMSFPPSSYVNLLQLGVDADDIRIMYYTDYGISMYSNGVIVPAKMIEEEPEVVEDIVRAVNRAWMATIENPEAAIDALVRRDSLIDRDLEMQRMEFYLDNQIITDEVRELGLGAVDAERLKESIDVVSKVFGVENPPAPDQVFDSRFLPPLEERMLNVGGR
ncbi:ABC transporter substrate-binding protein [Hydrocarboniclastica marina]|uniref:Taurine ABC transporter permease n=1 Tax=Hydrocarboniclastica marina TaxID=2259620 RepID=A0A4P7XJT7_9ALTE|nr:ABC transporter substrate-binding protein [Hydrocarboniclastica marina]MAM00115.1 taurine ABC transporter permease [Alteromonadaceae bacterium]QCF27426.1 taurine ABC transporter permease [Hydrocarboniclastica marina]